MRPEQQRHAAGALVGGEGLAEGARGDGIAHEVDLAEHARNAGELAGVTRLAELDLERQMLGHSTGSLASSVGVMLSGCIRASPPSIGGRFSRALASFADIQAAPAVAFANAS